LSSRRIRSVSLFFPVYKDEQTVRLVTEKALRLLRSLELEAFEVIIIDDGSPDRAGEIADRLARECQDVRVIHHPRNLGYGAAIRSGLAAARFEWILFTDGDDQYEIEDFRKQLRLSDRYDLLVSFRYKKIYSLQRVFISWVYNRLVQLIFHVQFRDISTALRMVRRELIDDLMLEATTWRNILLTIREVFRCRRSIFSLDYDLPPTRQRAPTEAGTMLAASEHTSQSETLT